jgi:hypothetical protein
MTGVAVAAAVCCGAAYADYIPVTYYVTNTYLDKYGDQTGVWRNRSFTNPVAACQYLVDYQNRSSGGSSYTYRCKGFRVFGVNADTWVNEGWLACVVSASYLDSGKIVSTDVEFSQDIEAVAPCGADVFTGIPETEVSAKWYEERTALYGLGAPVDAYIDEQAKLKKCKCLAGCGNTHGTQPRC